jgi:hypothetical protein
MSLLGALTAISTDPWVWVSVLWVIAGISFMWRDNKLYRLAESLSIGFGIGHGVNTALKTLNSQIYIPITVNGDLIAVLGLIIGLLVYVRFFVKGLGWLSRYPVSIMYGLGAGIAVTSMVKGFLIAIIVYYGTLSLGFEWIIAMLGTFGCLFYFIFMKEHKGVYGVVTKIGSAIMFMGVIGYHHAIYCYKSQPGAIERFGYIFREALQVIV